LATVPFAIIVAESNIFDNVKNRVLSKKAAILFLAGLAGFGGDNRVILLYSTGMDIFTRQYDITVGDVDKNHLMKPSCLFDFFQEITTVHGEDLGVGVNVMQNAGLAWVLSRFMVIVEQRPKFGQRIEITSWPHGSEKLFLLRDYLAKDQNGAILARARSRWIIIDIEKRKPLRPQSLPVPLPLNEGHDAVIMANSALAKRDNLVKMSERKAVYSDIDFNGHVNNARYIQWIQDAIPSDRIENARQLRFDINYITEVKNGETVEIFSAPFTCEETDANNTIFANPEHEAEKIAIEGIKTADGQSSFRAELRLV
jgi:acyl-ACP thioesterase